jgi:hypothetical protein
MLEAQERQSMLLKLSLLRSDKTERKEDIEREEDFRNSERASECKY